MSALRILNADAERETTYRATSDETARPLLLGLEHVGPVVVVDGEAGDRKPAAGPASFVFLAEVDEDLGVELLDEVFAELAKGRDRPLERGNGRVRPGDVDDPAGEELVDADRVERARESNRDVVDERLAGRRAGVHPCRTGRGGEETSKTCKGRQGAESRLTSDGDVVVGAAARLVSPRVGQLGLTRNLPDDGHFLPSAPSSFRHPAPLRRSLLA
jgi:hypothetical protein